MEVGKARNKGKKMTRGQRKRRKLNRKWRKR